MRLAQYLARAGISSRRHAEEIISQGEIKVNGQVVTDLGRQVEPGIDRVEYRRQNVTIQSLVYILFYKPVGCLTTVSDPFNRRTVMDYFPQIKARIYPVGRLDYDTSGLLLLSNDGDFTNQMTHPRYKIDKTYRVTVKDGPTAEQIEHLRRGVELEDGVTAPARVKILQPGHSAAILEITIHEGKKRQVKRMLASIGHPVLALERTAFAFLNLKGLKPGEHRFLTPDEVSTLLKAARGY